MAMYLLNWNANGLLPHSEELINYIKKTQVKPHIISIQETHFNILTIFNIPGYTTISNPRIDRKGGGTAIFVKNDIVLHQLPSNPDIEYTGIKIIIKFNKRPLHIFSVYLPPNRKINVEQLCNSFNYDNVIIMGDLNAKNPLWGSSVLDFRGTQIQKIIDINKLVCINTGEGTRLNCNGSLSHLDLTLVSPSLGALTNWEVITDTWGSDHRPNLITIGREPYCTLIKTQPEQLNFLKADWDAFRFSLIHTHINLTITVELPQLDLAVTLLNKDIIHAIQTSIPTKSKINNRITQPYWNNECTNAIKSRASAEKQMHRSKCLTDCIKYRQAKAKVKYVIKQAKTQYWAKYSNKLSYNSNLTKIWKTLRILNNVNKHKPGFIKIGPKTILDDKEKAEEFANEFIRHSSNANYPYDIYSTRKNTVNTFLSQSVHKPQTVFFEDLNNDFNRIEFERALEESNPNSAPGPDQIKFIMLKNLPVHLKEELLIFINTIWQAGTLPSMWKHAIINPILKNGKDPELVDSYRPIALTCAISKLMEKMVAKRLYWYLDFNSLINKNQSGFRKNYSTVDHAVRLKTEINYAITSGNITIAIFLDFSRAFDLVWTDGLLLKLLHLKITGNAIKYIKNFLENRTSKVTVGLASSNVYSLDNGTPQGSAISPLLFLIMINDFPKLTNFTSSCLFADDSGIWRSGTNLTHIVHELQADLHTISAWCVSWGFAINNKKTTGMVFTNKYLSTAPNLTINNIKISFAKSHTFLGFIFDEKVTWALHIANVVERCNSRLNLLRCLGGTSWGGHTQPMLIIYKAIIRSIIDYGSILYDTASPVQLKKLDTIQYKALAICTGAMRGTALAALQSECKELPLALRRKQQILKYCIKINSIPSHSANEILANFLSPPLSTKFKSILLPVLMEFNTNYKLKIHGPTLMETPPWQNKNFIIDTALVTKLENRYTVPSKLQMVSDHLSKNYSNHIRIYVDGARNTYGKAGVGIVIPQLNVAQSLRITDSVLAYTAEVMAIKHALLHIKDNKIEQSVIFSDCLTAIHDIKYANSTIRPNLINNIHKLLNSLSSDVTLCWIPSHSNIMHHDHADSLAKLALKNDTINSNIPLELKEANSMVDLHINLLWTTQPLKNNIAINYFHTFPKNIHFQKKTQLNRYREKIITRLRLHCCRLNMYLKKINLHPTGLCDVCLVPESVEHMILECKKTNSLTVKLKHIAGMLGVDLTLSNALTIPQLENSLIDYIIAHHIAI